MDVDELIGQPSEDVPSRNPTDDACNGKRVNKQTGEFKGYCKVTPGRGTDHVGEGRCKHHGGNNGGARDGAGAPEGNGNAITHGAMADPINLYHNLDDHDRAWVDGKVDAYIDDSDTDPAVDLVRLGVMHLYQAYAAHGQLVKEGVSRTSVVGTTDAGAITDEEEHYLNKIASRHTGDFRMAIKDAGKLDDPESQQAGAMQDTADAIRAYMHQADQ